MERNRVPSGSFDDPQVISESGWVDISYQLEGLTGKVSLAARDEAQAEADDEAKNKDQDEDEDEDEGRTKAKTKKKKAKKKTIRELDDAHSGRVIKLEVKAEQPDNLDLAQPAFLDFPVAAIRSPPIRVERNNLVRISVLVNAAFQSAGDGRHHRARLDRR